MSCWSRILIKSSSIIPYEAIVAVGVEGFLVLRVLVVAEISSFASAITFSVATLIPKPLKTSTTYEIHIFLVGENSQFHHELDVSIVFIHELLDQTKSTTK